MLRSVISKPLRDPAPVKVLRRRGRAQKEGPGREASTTGRSHLPPGAGGGGKLETSGSNFVIWRKEWEA